MDKPKILTSKELRAIMPRLAGWKLAQNKLSRTFEFQDFVQSLSFVNSLVAYFETIDHHPDVCIAELSPRTFCTFGRELSSLRRTVSRRRTARNVLE